MPPPRDLLLATAAAFNARTEKGGDLDFRSENHTRKKSAGEEREEGKRSLFMTSGGGIGVWTQMVDGHLLHEKDFSRGPARGSRGRFQKGDYDDTSLGSLSLDKLFRCILY